MKKILEIGGGTTPYFIRFNIPWTGEAGYVCVDVDEKRLLESKDALTSLKAKSAAYPAKAEFLVHDGISLPFFDMSHDEVVLSNVLSAPIHYNWNEAGDTVIIKNETKIIERPIQGSKEDGDNFYRERKPIIAEALRVLKPGGVLSIYTDLLVYGQHSYEKILNELKSDMSLVCSVDREEQARIDELNEIKKSGGELCYCFDADVLPESSVYRFTKIY